MINFWEELATAYKNYRPWKLSTHTVCTDSQLKPRNLRQSESNFLQLQGTMISRFTAVLLTLGLLSLVTARPVSHEEAKKQDISIDDLFTDKEIDDLLKSYSLLRLYRCTINSYYASYAGLSPSSNAEKQGFSTSFILPDGRTFEWGKEQGRRTPFNKGETQGNAYH